MTKGYDEIKRLKYEIKNADDKINECEEKKEDCIQEIKEILNSLFKDYDVSVKVCTSINYAMIISSDKFSKEFFRKLNSLNFDYDIGKCTNSTIGDGKLKVRLMLRSD